MKSKAETFIPDEPCKYGHYLRYKKKNLCVECNSIRAKAYRNTPEGQLVRKNTLKNWKNKNKDRVKKANRAWNLKALYNLTIEQFEKMSLQQNHCCKICLLSKKLVVDHCHITGKVRGLLCSRCNSGLGYFQDEANLMKRAGLYLTGEI